jgi:hypothetical protein
VLSAAEEGQAISNEQDQDGSSVVVAGCGERASGGPIASSVEALQLCRRPAGRGECVGDQCGRGPADQDSTLLGSKTPEATASEGLAHRICAGFKSETSHSHSLIGYRDDDDAGRASLE